MEELLSVRRMLELEKMVKDGNIVFPLTLKEWDYVERANLIPYNDISDIIILYKKYYIPMFQLISYKKIFDKYNCTEKELYKRIEDVHRIMKYENSINTNLLKEQKRMVKRMKYI